MLHVLSQIVQAQACGAVRCCGDLAGGVRQQLAGKRPGASQLNPQWSKTFILTFAAVTIFVVNTVCVSHCR